MASLNEITEFLNHSLHLEPCLDPSVDGLQVDGGTKDVKKVAYAVDSGLSVIEKAVAQKADLLIVHHGLFWRGTTDPITGVLGDKIRLLIDNKCSLFASHLPLDGHPTLGNGAQIAKRLNMLNITPYLKHSGTFIGAQGIFARPIDISEIAANLSKLPGAVGPLILPFGKKSISTCAIVTGAGAFALENCSVDNIDLLISGEPKQSAYHRAKELKISAIFAGHYATETVGVAALGQILIDKFKIETTFIHEPTGI